MPIVSVVVPTYNSENTLPRALDSVLSQTLSDLEIIIVDDGSTDETMDRVEEYKDPRITYIAHEDNKGGSVARNTGIQRSKGDYIAFLDSDDEWLPRKLEYQISALESRSNEWIAVHCERARNWPWRSNLGYMMARRVGARKPNPPKEGGSELIKEVLLGNLSTGASTLLITCDAVNQIGGFDPEFPRHQDWEFLIRILKLGKLAHIDKPLVIKHGTGKPGPEVYEEAKDKLLSKFAEDIAQLERKGYPITRRQEMYLGKAYFEDGKIRTGASYISFSEIGLIGLLSVVWSLALGMPQLVSGIITINWKGSKG